MGRPSRFVTIELALMRIDHVLLPIFTIDFRAAHKPVGGQKIVKLFKETLTCINGPMRHFCIYVSNIVQQGAGGFKGDKLRTLQVHPEEIDRIDFELPAQVVQPRTLDFYLILDVRLYRVRAIGYEQRARTWIPVAP